MHVAEPLHHGQSVEIKHMQHMYYWGTVGGPSPRGLDAIAWASAGGGAARILAVPPGGPACTLARRRFLAGTWRAPLQGGRRSPVVSAGGGRAGRRGPGPFSACGGWVAPGRPPSDLASPRAEPLAAHPAPGACPASRAPAGPDGPRRPWRGAAGGGGSDRGMRRPRGGGGERRRQPRGEGECGVFFYFTRGNRGSNAERDSNASRGPRGSAGRRGRRGTRWSTDP